MYTVELVDNYDDVSVCNDFDFETITEAYAFLWQCRESWKDEKCDVLLYHDSEIFAVYDDYSV